METLSGVALILSAGAMIALAFLTYRSVSILSKDSARTNRPIIYVEGIKSPLTSKWRDLTLNYTICNAGNLPGYITSEETSANHNNCTSFTWLNKGMVLFPKQTVTWSRQFSTKDAITEGRKFDIHIEIHYCDLTDKSKTYDYEVDYQISTEEEEVPTETEEGAMLEALRERQFHIINCDMKNCEST